MADQAIVRPQTIVFFGPFELDPLNRTLKKAGMPVRVRERELSILIYLAERAGIPVSRDELMAAIWPQTRVSDANVRVQIAALKRILGDSNSAQAYLTFSYGHGYRFNTGAPASSYKLPVKAECETDNTSLSSRSPVYRRHNLPVRIKPWYGRQEALECLSRNLPHHRLVTIVGPGGIGKTTLALSCADSIIDAYEDGIRLIDLAKLADPALMPAVFASALDISLLSADPVDDIIDFLKTKQTLILLDNCEHVICAAAKLAETILTRTQNVYILTTSREPLRADGEWLFRLGPLDLPPTHSAFNASEIAVFSAVKLFIERARLQDAEFSVVDADTFAITDLCHRLDGNPLAIELAAARVGLFGIKGLAQQLAESVSFLTKGRRTALPRHQTLQAMLDWSFQILPEREQTLLARLSVFRGDFTLASAMAVAGHGLGTLDDIVDALAELVAKSLVNANTFQHPATYRLLFLTRDYAMKKLRASDDFELVTRKHATRCLDLVHSADQTLSVETPDLWVDDVRSALDWTLSDTGDAELAIALIDAAFGTALKVMSIHERAPIVARAKARIEKLQKRYPLFELRLLIEQISIFQFGGGNEQQMLDLAAEAKALAEYIQTQDGIHRPLIEAFITLASIYFGRGNGREMLRQLEMITAMPLSEEDKAGAQVTLARMTAQAEYLNGNHEKSMHFVHEILSCPADVLAMRHFTMADFLNPASTVRMIQARILWITGFSEQAASVAEEVLHHSRGFKSIMICYTLAFSVIPIAIWRGQYQYARSYLNEMDEGASNFGYAYWQTWVHYYETTLNWLEGVPGTAGPVLTDLNALQIDHLPSFSPFWADVPEQFDPILERWNAPEIYRVRGERALSLSQETEAEQLFLKALELAKSQGALAWELRAATSLAQFWYQQGRGEAGQDLLCGVLDKFQEGAEDLDRIRANKLILSLRPGAKMDASSTT